MGKRPLTPLPPGADEPRRLIFARLEADPNLTMKALSKIAGRNDAYVHQYLYQGTPRILSEEDRERLAKYLEIPQEKLKGSRKSKREISTENVQPVDENLTMRDKNTAVTTGSTGVPLIDHPKVMKAASLLAQVNSELTAAFLEMVRQFDQRAEAKGHPTRRA